METERYYIQYAEYRGISPFSKSIQIRTIDWRSHISIVHPDGQRVKEAWHKGVDKEWKHWTADHKPGTEIYFYRIEVTKEQFEKFYAAADKYGGLGYDYLGIYGFAVFKDIHNPNRLFCSEYFLQCCKDAGCMPLDIEPHKASPRDVGLIPKGVKERIDYRVVPGKAKKKDFIKVKTIND